MTHIEITAVDALNIKDQNQGRSISNLEHLYLDITKAAHCGCDFIIAKQLSFDDRKILIKRGFKIDAWHYNQQKISWYKTED